MSADREVALVAWEVEISDMTAVVFAATKPKARWIAVKEYRAAGYGVSGSWPSMSVRRVERYDNSPLRDQGPKCWTPSYVEELRP